jgi:ABC-type antimicrobial peptide transport system permease subunit
VLTAAGVYGVMSYSVASRRSEMGVRLALGARPQALLAQVLQAGVVMAVIGVALGLGAAWMLGGVVSRLLFQMAPHDPATFVAVAILLLSTATLAWYVRRGAPLVSIRSRRYAKNDRYPPLPAHWRCERQPDVVSRTNTLSPSSD